MRNDCWNFHSNTSCDVGCVIGTNWLRSNEELGLAGVITVEQHRFQCRHHMQTFLSQTCADLKAEISAAVSRLGGEWGEKVMAERIQRFSKIRKGNERLIISPPCPRLQRDVLVIPSLCPRSHFLQELLLCLVRMTSPTPLHRRLAASGVTPSWGTSQSYCSHSFPSLFHHLWLGKEGDAYI